MREGDLHTPTASDMKRRLWEAMCWHRWPQAGFGAEGPGLSYPVGNGPAILSKRNISASEFLKEPMCSQNASLRTASRSSTPELGSVCQSLSVLLPQ